MTLPKTLRAVAHAASRTDAPCPWEALDADEKAVFLALAEWVERDRLRVPTPVTDTLVNRALDEYTNPPYPDLQYGEAPFDAMKRALEAVMGGDVQPRKVRIADVLKDRATNGIPGTEIGHIIIDEPQPCAPPQQSAPVRIVTAMTSVPQIPGYMEGYTFFAFSDGTVWSRGHENGEWSQISVPAVTLAKGAE